VPDDLQYLLDERAAAKRLYKALETIVGYDTRGKGCCPYGCDCPAIAAQALITIKAPGKHEEIATFEFGAGHRRNISNFFRPRA
jgi:hypothetical protein